LSALAKRGHEIRAAESGRPAERATLVLGPGLLVDPMALGVLLGAWRTAPGARVLTLSLIGAHPDARTRRLKQMWEIEERARGCGMPALTLRLAPMVGPESPFWLRLRSSPRLPRAGRQQLNPVCEEDVIETIDRALHGRAVWDGWYELAGEEVLTLVELGTLAAAAGPPLPRGSGDWEPPLEEIAEHRLSEADAWQSHFDLVPGRVRERAKAWTP
jgi:uncharacterized protein YbjT (DUF2867 family)